MTRIWLALMGALTAVTTAPYLITPAKAVIADGLAIAGPEAPGRALVAFGMQGVAMGLYCIWGAVSPARAREALRVLVLYMACIAVGRAVAAAPFFSQPTSMMMITFYLDTAITVISALIFLTRLKDPSASLEQILLRAQDLAL